MGCDCRLVGIVIFRDVPCKDTTSPVYAFARGLSLDKNAGRRNLNLRASVNIIYGACWKLGAGGALYGYA